jgi:hypothetical protein
MGKNNFLVITIAIAVLSLALGFAAGSAVRASLSDNDEQEQSSQAHRNEKESEEEMMGHKHAHDHEMLEVNEDAPIPAIGVDILDDKKSGYNLYLQLENFNFTPENVNQSPVDNEGHAHLFVNGEKIMRVYSQWIHIGNDRLDPGENEVVITLNANDHSEYVLNGEHIEARLTLER